jgi:hypothetical protein
MLYLFMPVFYWKELWREAEGTREIVKYSIVGPCLLFAFVCCSAAMRLEEQVSRSWP